MRWTDLCSIIGCPIGFLYLLHVFLSQKNKKNIKNKVVLITGASSGLGKACAKVFSKAGCRLILCSRNVTELQKIQESLINNDGTQVQILPIDLTDLGKINIKIQEAIKLYGQIDVVINNAGVSYRGLVQDTLLDVDQQVMLVNYFGQVAVTKAVLPSMLTRGEGCIVAISSVQGRIAIPYRSAYAASKHAFQAFYDCLRAELVSNNIQVCVVSPGYINTNLSNNAICGDGTQYGALDKNTASGMRPEYVADKVLSAVTWGEKEVVLAPLPHKLAIVLRALAPTIYFLIMAKRAKNGKKEYIKQS